MNIKYKILFTAIALLLAVMACLGIYYYVDTKEDTSTIEYILNNQRSPNRFTDLAKDINVQSVDDIGYIVRGKYNISIHYGDQVIKMTKKCFEDPEYHTLLAWIGIEVKTHKEDDEHILYKVTYWGENVQELSLVD